ncbi:membrane protein [Malaciobacter pacificus]|uniref:YeiH/YadS family membrane protein n=1 Tax=Malaciobacter pacificus TaxID=1080223 RepID=A0A5C2H809_9BACT|nr:putative sulfate exporter family transporter [Malaciobacter pacificus]QEP34358.1 YeiH/YadS family membrane protein [Malaciobacter pacificus]GGD38154.1 membrane protein [Malaciobacter pacificus]
MDKLYGIFLCVVIALGAIFLSNYIIIGSVAIAVILGALIGNTMPLSSKFNSGITFSEKTLLAIAISLLGINLDFNILMQLGFNTIIIIILSLIATIFFGTYIANQRNFDKTFAQILSIGNGVCGSAAIAATKDIVKLDKQKAALAVAIVNLLGTVGLFILPIIGLLLGLNDVDMGILLGNTLQSVGHAIAAGFSVNETVGQSATITKMGRILLLTPIIIWLIFQVSKNSTTQTSLKEKISVPFFIVGFIITSILATSGILPKETIDLISNISELTLIIAMSAIGLKISFNAIKQSGWDAFVLAGYIFKFQIILTILLIAIL